MCRALSVLRAGGRPPLPRCFNDLPDGEGLHPFSSEMPQLLLLHGGPAF